MLTESTADCGIYRIWSGGKFYIGSSKRMTKRVYHHAWCASNGRFRRSPKLYRAIAKHGFTWERLLVCAPGDLQFYEQRCLGAFNPELNCSPDASRVAMTPEVRAKIGAAHRRRVVVTCAVCGTEFFVKPCHASVRKLCSQQCAFVNRRGKPRTEACKAAISAAKRGRPNGLSGRPRSDEAKEKIRRTMTGRKYSPESVAASREGMARAREAKRAQ